MWKKILLIFALHLCGEICANSIYRGNNNEWPANNFDQVVKDFNSYHQKLQHQGFVPSPLFVLHNNANHLGQTFGPGQYHQKPEFNHHVEHQKPEYHHQVEHHQKIPEYHQKPEYHHKPGHHQVEQHKPEYHQPEHHQKTPEYHHKPEEHHKTDNHHQVEHQKIPEHHHKLEEHHKYIDIDKYTTTTRKPTTTTKKPFIKGNNEFLYNIKDDFVAAVKKPFELVTPKHHDWAEKHHEKVNEKVVEKVINKKEEALNKLQDKVEKVQDKADSKLATIKNQFDKQVNAVSQFNDDVYTKISAQTTKVFDAINKKLEDIESKLQKLRPGSVKSIDDEEIAEIEDVDEMRSLIDDDGSKNKVADAFKKAQDKFNQVIEDNVAKVNNKINEMNEKVENLFGKLQTAVKKVKPTKKVYTPPTYKPTAPSVIDWKPKATTWSPIDKDVTPDYYRYTVRDDYRNENATDNVEVTTEEMPTTSVADVEMALAEELRSELEAIDEEKSDDLTQDENFDEGEDLEEDFEVPEDEVTDILDNVPLNDEEDSSNNFNFDELEVIRLIPVIIEQLRAGKVTTGEMSALEKIFGNLWSLMLAEAERDVNGLKEMNPLLRTVLNSEEVRLAKRDITAQIGNDIYKNSLRRVYRGDGESKSPKPYISLDDDRKLLSPSERLLNMVAAIVHKSNVAEKAHAKKARQLARKKKQQKRLRKQQNPFGIVTVQKPKQRYVDRILSINRMKRSLIKFESDLADMKALLEHVNHENDTEDNLTDDYMDDESDYDYQQLSTPENVYDDWYSNRRVYDDYEDGSVNEFINLAQQRDRREQNTAEWEESLESNDEDYDYDAYDEN